MSVTDALAEPVLSEEGHQVSLGVYLLPSRAVISHIPVPCHSILHRPSSILILPFVIVEVQGEVRNSGERLLIFELNSQFNYTPPSLLPKHVDWLELCIA